MLIPTAMGRASRLPHLDFFILILQDCLGAVGRGREADSLVLYLFI